MANNDRRQGAPGGVRVTGAGRLVVIVILVVIGMVLFGKKRGEPQPTADRGPGAYPSEPQPQSQRPPQQQRRPVEPLQKRTVGNEGWSIEEVETKRTATRPAPPKESKVTRKGEWSIEEVPAEGEEKPAAELRLRTQPGVKPGAEAQETKKGDWSIEEVPTDTRPAGELKLSEPAEPKSTKKGDWELEVD